MKAFVRRTCTLISLLCTTALLVMIWAAVVGDIVGWVGLTGVITGAVAWRLDDRPKVEPPAL